MKLTSNLMKHGTPEDKVAKLVGLVSCDDLSRPKINDNPPKIAQEES